MALLEVRGLRARYGSLEALHGLDMSVERGAIVALLGPNGAGKSSALRALSGMVDRTGDLRFNGRSLRRVSPEGAARLGIAHVLEGRGTLGALSVAENLLLGAYTVRDRKRVRARRERILASFPWLAAREKHPAAALSGGEQQILALARALMMEPQLMLLDEPSLGLGPLVARDVFALLASINREDGVAMLLAEQNVAAALRIATSAYVLENGRIAVHASSAELLADDRIRRSYLGY